MSFVQPRTQRGAFHGNTGPVYSRHHNNNVSAAGTSKAYNHHRDNQSNGVNHLNTYYNQPYPFSRVCREYVQNPNSYIQSEVAPPMKKRKFSASSWEDSGRQNHHPNVFDNVPPKYPTTESYGTQNYMPQNCHNSYNNVPSTNKNTSAATVTNGLDSTVYNSSSSKRGRSIFEEDDIPFMSRDEIEKCSPSRKDGIDAMHEMHLRYSYCSFLQNVGLQLELPQTTVGTAMVLCHRFFLRRSHASHDRFLIATAALFLAAKSEETARPLNNVLRVSCEIYHKQDFALLSYVLPLDWFEQYRERVIEAEQLLLTTLNFELGVQHPYDPLISTLEKLGFSQSVLVNLALNLLLLASWLRSSLWLQFKPQQIAAGAAYLAAKFLNVDLASYHSVWQEFQTPQPVLKDVARQLMELF